MQKQNSTELSVRLPKVTLKPEEVAYLQSLANGGVHCEMTQSQKARLRVLGLIDLGDVERSTEQKAAARKRMSDAIQSLRAAIKAKDRNAARSAIYEWERAEFDAMPQRGYSVTKDGHALLKAGEVTIKVKGCGQR